jgi:hypothetical protein
MLENFLIWLAIVFVMVLWAVSLGWLVTIIFWLFNKFTTWMEKRNVNVQKG